MTKPHASPQNKGKDRSLTERRGKLGGAIRNTNTPLEYTGSSKYGAFSLAEMWLSLIGWHVVGEEENRSSSCWDIKVVSLCKVHLFLLGLLLVSEKAWELPPLASWFHFKWGFLLLILIVMTWGYLQTSEQKTDRKRGERKHNTHSVLVVSIVRLHFSLSTLNHCFFACIFCWGTTPKIFPKVLLTSSEHRPLASFFKWC